MPKGKGDLVVYLGNLWSEPGIVKVAILRNFEIMADKAITLSYLDLKDPEEVEGFTNIFYEFLIGGITTAFTTSYYNEIKKQYKIPSSLKSTKDLYYFHHQVWTKENGGPFMYGEYTDEWPSSKPFDESTISPTALPLTPFSTETISGKLRLNIATHNPNISGINTLMYVFNVERYSEVSEWGNPVVDVSYRIFISSGYIEKIGTGYTLPTITDAAFDELNIKYNQRVKLIKVISSNGSLKEYFIPKNGIKIMEQYTN